MSQLQDPFKKSQGLLGAMDAITHRRAFITLYATFALAAMVLAGIGAIAANLMFSGHYDGGRVIGLIGALIVVVTTLLGTSATGFLLNDTVRGRQAKTISQAIWASIATVHRSIGVLAILLVLALSAALIVFVAMVVCKLPGLGVLLFTVVFPASVVLLGMIAVAAFFIVTLHGPAIWEGNSVIRAVSVLGTIFRERFFPMIIQTILLGLLVGLVASLIFGVVAVGVTMTSAFSIPVVGQSIGSINVFQLLQIFGGESSGSDYFKAGIFGMLLLSGLAMTIPVLVALAGTCIIFANVTENLSTEEVDQKLQGALDVARQQAELARRQLEEARAQTSAPNVAQAGSRRCPKCMTPSEPGDVFCGSCGHQMA